jgi:hypothetical protein
MVENPIMVEELSPLGQKNIKRFNYLMSIANKRFGLLKCHDKKTILAKASF